MEKGFFFLYGLTMVIQYELYCPENYFWEVNEQAISTNNCTSL